MRTYKNIRRMPEKKKNKQKKRTFKKTTHTSSKTTKQTLSQIGCKTTEEGTSEG